MSDARQKLDLSISFNIFLCKLAALLITTTIKV
jgi:hypothetical protein